MSTRKKSSRDKFVIIRAMADEPVRLKLVGVRGRSIDVVGSDETCPMPFHLERTYQFDPELFEKMAPRVRFGEPGSPGSDVGSGPSICAAEVNRQARWRLQ